MLNNNSCQVKTWISWSLVRTNIWITVCVYKWIIIKKKDSPFSWDVLCSVKEKNMKKYQKITCLCDFNDLAESALIKSCFVVDISTKLKTYSKMLFHLQYVRRQDGVRFVNNYCKRRWTRFFHSLKFFKVKEIKWNFISLYY